MAKKVEPRGPGRPTRKEASQSALDGVDVSAIDPLDVLRQVAADASAPASARVSAARALLKLGPQPDSSASSEHLEPDPVARRALRILKGGKK